MSPTYLLALDVGGGGGRCFLVDAERGASFVASRACTHPVAEGTGGTGSELDLPALWRKLGEASREVLARAGARPEQVAGVSATAVRFGSVVLDGEGRALQAGPNRDARGAGEAIALALEHGEGLAADTGHWPAPILPAARALHLRKNDPDAFARAARLVAVSDWLVFRLCGEIASDASMAGCTGLYRADGQGWAWDWIERLGLPRGLFPEVRAAGERAGALSADAARHLGLAAGTPVGIGG
ncbi:MAG TPA: FGGY family carbohydrate kinase, partial [Myxococcota bacterium]|nr:FGGY family carbohydrate kinase [Myxococcota bacterium]